MWLLVTLILVYNPIQWVPTNLIESPVQYLRNWMFDQYLEKEEIAETVSWILFILFIWPWNVDFSSSNLNDLRWTLARTAVMHKILKTGVPSWWVKYELRYKDHRQYTNSQWRQIYNSPLFRRGFFHQPLDKLVQRTIGNSHFNKIKIGCL